MKKLIKKITKIVLCLIAFCITSLIVVEFFYFPRYLIKKEQVEVDNSTTNEITIMSSNVRCISPDDLFKKSWFYRASLIKESIYEVKPDVIGFQEATWVHYNYLTDILNDYDSVITYRDNFILSEGCPIFYRKDKFDLLDKGSFWLSKTPEVMSKDWGSKHNRITSYVILKEKATNKEFVVFNTHLDHVSDEARINGINVVLDKIQQFGGKPSILMGDFNAYVGSKTIDAAYEVFDDACNIAKVNLQEGYKEATFHNWGNKLDNKRIDYIMVSKEGIDVSLYDVLDKTYNDVYASDHFAIYIKMKLL